MGRWITVGGWVCAFWVAVILWADPEVLASPISLNWVHATVRVENEWGQGARAFS